MATLLADRQAFHRAVLVEKVAADAPATMERMRAYVGLFLSKGFDLSLAREKALGILDGSVEVQAAVMSFGDTFFATGCLLVVTAPLVFLLGKGGGKVDMGGH